MELFVFYDGPEPPAGLFDQFMDAGPTSKTLVSQNFLSLIESFKFTEAFAGLRYVLLSLSQASNTTHSLTNPARRIPQYIHPRCFRASTLSQISQSRQCPSICKSNLTHRGASTIFLTCTTPEREPRAHKHHSRAHARIRTLPPIHTLTQRARNRIPLHPGRHVHPVCHLGFVDRPCV